MELRIIELEDILKHYELIDEKKTSKKTRGVAIGSEVTIKSSTGDTFTYKIVGPTETDIFKNKISNESPIGSSLIGKEPGEVATGKSGSGAFEFTIISIA